MERDDGGRPGMRDRPHGAELLAEVGRVLSEDLAPALRGEQRYAVLLCAAAVAIVRRELEAGDAWGEAEREALGGLLGADGELASLNRRLADAIREGRFDGDPALHALLRDSVRTRVRETNPRILETGGS
jgi:hypothetical protein